MSATHHISMVPYRLYQYFLKKLFYCSIQWELTLYIKIKSSKENTCICEEGGTLNNVTKSLLLAFSYILFMLPYTD